MSFTNEVVQIISHSNELYGIDDYGQLYKFYFGDAIVARTIKEIPRESGHGACRQTMVVGRKNVGWRLIEDYEDELLEGFEIISD